jgi:hypothetical protein
MKYFPYFLGFLALVFLLLSVNELFYKNVNPTAEISKENVDQKRERLSPLPVAKSSCVNLKKDLTIGDVDKGNSTDVVTLQRFLVKEGYLDKNFTVNGKFSSSTLDAVKTWEKTVSGDGSFLSMVGVNNNVRYLMRLSTGCNVDLDRDQILDSMEFFLKQNYPKVKNITKGYPALLSLNANIKDDISAKDINPSFYFNDYSNPDRYEYDVPGVPIGIWLDDTCHLDPSSRDLFNINNVKDCFGDLDGDGVNDYILHIQAPGLGYTSNKALVLLSKTKSIYPLIKGEDLTKEERGQIVEFSIMENKVFYKTLNPNEEMTRLTKSSYFYFTDNAFKQVLLK